MTPDLQVALAELLTVAEFADQMRVSERTVWRWIKAGKVEAIRVGGHGHWRMKSTKVAGMSVFVSSTTSA